MSMLQVRNIPERLKRSLRKRASDEGVSMSDFVRRLIQEELERPRAEDILRALERLPTHDDGFSGAQLLREARREAGADR